MHDCRVVKQEASVSVQNPRGVKQEASVSVQDLMAAWP
ncbi:Hypothetical protein A7982_06321 [Minicystis rosea]|nr:Hypothetical protein A7982_06321 [Minicystis rosea]